ncbi:uroporphyrinogen decarboxylase family protein [Chloroflexota bacterium]
MWKGRLPIEGAPYWYNTPIEELDFEWTREEKVEIERYCEKISKNIEEEGGMTPRERLRATAFGKDKDRMVYGYNGGNVYPARVMDSFSDAIKPIDVYRYPKMYVKAHLATVARFGLDWAFFHNINYGEDMWGGQSKMIEYGNPIMSGPAPIKTIEDMEGMPIPDPHKDGLYPGYLWAFREYRRILDEYNIPHPVWGSICVGPTLTLQMAMMGWTEFAIALRKDKELVRRCIELSTEWLIRFGKALIDAGEPDVIQM